MSAYWKRLRLRVGRSETLILGPPCGRVPSGDSVLILRGGVVSETRPIVGRVETEPDPALDDSQSDVWTSPGATEDVTKRRGDGGGV